MSSDPFSGQKDEEEVTYPTSNNKRQQSLIGANIHWALRWFGHGDLAIFQRELVSGDSCGFNLICY